MNKKYKHNLVVTNEAIKDFLKLSVSQRLQWLDKMRAFLANTLPRKVKKNWKHIRE